MDISRSSNPQSQPMRTNQEPQQSSHMPEKKSHRRGTGTNWTKLSEVILLFAGTVLVVALLFGIYQGGPSEDKYVNTSKFQAVFLNGGVTNGQVLYSTYFGHITALNSQFLVLQDVYYITTNSSSSTTNSNVQLTKLGCQQLHAPYDLMVINRDQVAFWENLESTGQVATAIANYQKENPNGPNCSQTSNSTSTTSTPTTTNSSAATANSSTPEATTNTTTP